MRSLPERDQNKKKIGTTISRPPPTSVSSSSPSNPRPHLSPTSPARRLLTDAGSPPCSARQRAQVLPRPAPPPAYPPSSSSPTLFPVSPQLLPLEAGGLGGSGSLPRAHATASERHLPPLRPRRHPRGVLPLSPLRRCRPPHFPPRQPRSAAGLLLSYLLTTANALGCILTRDDIVLLCDASPALLDRISAWWRRLGAASPPPPLTP